MVTVQTVVDLLEEFAPAALAEDWDNVGLLVGDRTRPVEKVMTCLTLTRDCAQEAIDAGANLIVTHHPLPFRPLLRLTTDTSEGRVLWDLIGAQIAIYSPHTAFDSARAGINQRLAEGIGLTEIVPLVESASLLDEGALGSGRVGELSEQCSLADFIRTAKEFLGIGGLHSVGEKTGKVKRVAVACGSGGTFLDAAILQHADTLLTGETSFHTCLEARSRGLQLVLPGHYASERFALELLAEHIDKRLTLEAVWASRVEQDPLTWIS